MNRAAPEPKANMGQPEPRIDGRLKVTGEARYGSDFPVSNPAFAFLVTSAIAKGRIERIDLADAKSVPGVLEIFTHENTRRTEAGRSSSAAAAARPHRSQDSARDPARRPDRRAWWSPIRSKPRARRPTACKIDLCRGTAERDVRLARRHRGGRQQGQRARQGPAAGRRRRGRLSPRPKSSSTPNTARRPSITTRSNCSPPPRLARRRADDLRAEPVRVRPEEQRRRKSSASIAETGARRQPVRRRRVRLQGAVFAAHRRSSPTPPRSSTGRSSWSRPATRASPSPTYRAETRHRIRIGARARRQDHSFIHEGCEVTSRPDPYAVAGVEDSARLYGFGAVKTHVTLVHADRNTPGFMRSPPVVPYIYALESAMDELAIKLDMDPVELRRVNDSMKDTTGKQWSSRSLMKCYDQAAEALRLVASATPSPARCATATG